MNFDIKYFKEIAPLIFNIDSPSGYSIKINDALCDILRELGYEPIITKKGNVLTFIKGQSSEKVVATSAHVDTLGLMVRSINGN